MFERRISDIEETENEAWGAMGENNRRLITRIRELEARMKC